MNVKVTGWRIAASFLFLSLALSGCDITSPTEGIRVLFNEDPLTTVSVEVIDAKSKQQIKTESPDSVRIAIEGVEKYAVIDLTENPKTAFSSTAGYFTFAIAEDRETSRDSPLALTIIAKSPGYISSSKPLTITSSKGETYAIALVKRADPPSGAATTSKTDGTADAAGAVQDSIVVVSDPEPVTKTGVTVKVQKGTVVKDEQGEVLTGELKTEITQFTSTSEESLNSFPGGLLPNIVDKNGDSADVLFVPAAFVSLEITDTSGKAAKTFDKPVDVSITIPGDTTNPETGAKIKDGDVVPIWNYDEDHASWVYHSNSVASGPDDNGNFKASFSITHLSYWSVGWEDTAGEICEEGATISIVGGFTTLELKIKKQSDGSYLSSLGKSVEASDPFIHLLNTPGNIPVVIEAWYGTDIVGSVEIDTLCGEDIVLPVDIPGKTVTFSVEVFDKDDTEKRMRPNRGIYIDENGVRKYVGYMEDGTITVYGLTEGLEYTFWVFHDDVWYSGTHTVDNRTYAELEFPVEPGSS